MPTGDFPDVARFRHTLATNENCRDFTKFKKLDERILQQLDSVIREHCPQLMSEFEAIPAAVASEEFVDQGVYQGSALGLKEARKLIALVSHPVSDATATVRTPARSNVTTSCMMHVVHEPQSANAMIAASLVAAMRFAISRGKGLANAGFEYRVHVTSYFASCCSTPSRTS